MRRRLLLAASVVLASMTAVAAPAHDVDALLEWRTAYAAGAVAVQGPAWTLRIAYDPGAPPPPAVQFLLEAERVVAREDHRDYTGTPAGIVSRDAQTQTDETVLPAARLSLAEARKELQLLVVPNAAQGLPFLVDLHAASADFDAQDRVHASLWSDLPGFQPPAHVQRVYDRDAPAVHVSPKTDGAPLTLLGSFTVYVWDVDVRASDGSSRVFWSGIRTSPAAGPGGAGEGTLTDSRIQLLTLHVEHGRLSLAVPERLHTLQYDSTHVALRSAGSWDLSEARGELTWGGVRNALSGSALTLSGAFEVDLTGPAESGRVRSHWTGQADAVRAGDLPLVTVPPETAGLGGGLLWVGLAGAAVAAGGLGTAYWRRDGNRRVAHSLMRGDYEGGLRASDRALRRGHDTRLYRGIALLKLGRAQEAVETLEAAAGHGPAEAIRAYLLSLAHARLGAREATVQWFLQAVQLNPGFAHEVDTNEDLRPIRHHPRIRKALGRGEDHAYA